ncbi:MAG: diaminopimelate epimerase [Candidatus Kapabacteria bacterium]|nr:diaminopimelate epimerase [Candidatus Kapabacteria bacterium]
MTFYHMSGAGNTFLVADGRNFAQVILEPHEVREIVARNPRLDGSPVEGVLILRVRTSNSFDADYYNPDGSYGMMCGNGSRCIVRFAVDRGLDASSEILFTLNKAPYGAFVNDSDTISVVFPPPRLERTYASGELDGIDIAIDYVDVGSDHVVISGPLDASRPIVRILRNHAEFINGTNVNMTNIQPNGTVNIATFERGVEDITGACGTGALSAAVSLWRKALVSDTVEFTPPSGRRLIVRIEHDGATITNLILQGDARYDNA